MARTGTLASLLEREQADFAALAQTLSDEQWTAPSACADWTVQDVIVHAAGHGHRTLRETFGRGDKAADRLRDLDRDALTDVLASPVQARAGWDMKVQLCELVIHQQDVRRPLGMPRDIPPECVGTVLTAILSTGVGALVSVGARKRAGGLRLVATDLDWSSGSGAEVRGPGEALLMAIAGRSIDPTELAGEGASSFFEDFRSPTEQTASKNGFRAAQ